jgi:class 3 adenylate cyclase/ketosteroid isomerase-like protein
MKADAQTEREVIAVILEELRCYANRDVEACLSFWVPDEDTIVFGGAADETAVGLKGWSRIIERDFAQTSAAAMAPGPIHVFAVDNVAWAIYEGRFFWTRDGREFSLPTRNTTILERRSHRWLLSHIHVSNPIIDVPGESFPQSIDSILLAIRTAWPDLTGHVAPDGTLTIFFSDIVDSTSLAQRVGDRKWLALLKAHNRIIRRELQMRDGYEVKTIGDGFMIVFKSARDAVSCAIGIQKSLRRRRKSKNFADLHVRIGVHIGEPLKDQGDFYGQAVIKTARIAGRAAADQILVSSLVEEIIASDIQFLTTEWESTDLKGLSGRHTIFEVRYDSEMSTKIQS